MDVHVQGVSARCTLAKFSITLVLEKQGKISFVDDFRNDSQWMNFSYKGTIQCYRGPIFKGILENGTKVRKCTMIAPAVQIQINIILSFDGGFLKVIPQKIAMV